MKSRLFSRERLDDLIRQNSVTVLIDVLLNSPYAREMAEALTRFSGADAVEDGLARNLSDTFRRIIHVAQGTLRQRTELFLMHWDLFVVKSLLRRRHHAGSLEASSYFPASANLTPAMVTALSDKPDLESLVGALAAWHPEVCAPLVEKFPVYRDTGRLAVLEEALDQAYYVHLAGRFRDARDEDDRQFARVLRMYIDLINLRTILMEKIREERLESTAVRETSRDLHDRLLPHGTLEGQLLRRLASADHVENVVELLGSTPYSVLVHGLYQFVQSGRFSPLERVLHYVILKDLGVRARENGLRFAVVMHYAWLKFNEVLNLRMIARGIAAELPVGRIQEEVLYA